MPPGVRVLPSAIGAARWPQQVQTRYATLDDDLEHARRATSELRGDASKAVRLWEYAVPQRFLSQPAVGALAP